MTSSSHWRPGALLATLLANVYLVVGSVVFALLALAVSWIPPRGHWVFHCARAWARGLLATSGARVRATFEEPLEDRLPVVFMANHESLLDIPALLVSLPGQTRMLAKHDLFKIPIFGWALRAGGFIAVDRQDRSRAGRSFAAAVERLRGGVSALVFPEGTRSADGRIGAFQRGGFLLAMKSDLPVVPVGIRGSAAVQAKGSRWIRPGVIQVVFGAPVPVEGLALGRRRELTEEVRRRVAELALRELR